MSQNSVEKDVCEFYGVSHEKYNIIVNGIGITDALKKYGIEIDETKLSNAGNRNKEKRRIRGNETKRICSNFTKAASNR